MNLSENYIWNIIRDYFEKEGFISHQIETFDDYINNGIPRVIQESDIVINQDKLKYKVIFQNVYIPSPIIIEEDRKIRKLFPLEARQRDLTYDSPIFVDIKETIEIEDSEPEINIYRRVNIGRTPIMLESSKCNLKTCSKNEKIKKGECDLDKGGYFIIKGKERVLIGQLRGIYNIPIVIAQKSGEKYKYSCDVRSMSEETGHSILLQVKIGTDDRTIVFCLPNIKELIPVGIVFKALGFVNDEDIINIIGNTNPEVQKYYKYIIRDSYFIRTQKDALKYIGQFSIHIIKEDKREDYALQIVENELLPHMGITSTIKEKSFFLGYMISKLLNTSCGLRNEDDRDNYTNKRVEMAGVLCCELFRTLFKRYTKNIQLQLEKKKQRPDILSVISRTTSITMGLKHSFCFPEGTLISFSNGLSYPIELLTKLPNNENILGWNGKGLISTKYRNVINQGTKDTIKLTFEDGRTLVCTPEHKILVLKKDKTTEWVEAYKIPIESRIIMGLDNPIDSIEDDLNNEWSLETKNKNNIIVWKVSTLEERTKTLALMRILGYIICDRHIPIIEKNQGTIYISTLYDLECFLNDYEIVVGKEKIKKINFNDVETEKWGKCYEINICNFLTNILRSIDGVLVGKKVIQERRIPTFLMENNCPKSVIREFLGGLFGGDGHSPRLDIRKGQRTSIQSVAFSWTTQKKNIKILHNTFENICILLEKIGVKNTYINGPYEISGGDNDRLFYRITISSVFEFHKKIGFRYCIHKNYKINIIASYLRMEKEIKRQHSFILNTVNDLKNKQNITIKKALEIARNELIEKEYILNTYYSMSSEKDILKRREHNRSKELKKLEEKFGVKDAKDFINEMGALYMFEKNYTMDRDSIEIPTFSLKLMDIRNCKKQIVYDLTDVEICNSFLANGLVVHNCTGNWGVQKNSYIRTGVSQVLSRMNYGSTLSHLRRVVIPIGKEGKNAKIRQPHVSQIFYLCPNETPEGQSIGIVMNLSLLTKVTKRIPTVIVKELIENTENFIFINDFNDKNIYPKIFLNGILMGITKNPLEFLEELKILRKNGVLDKSISFVHDDLEKEIKIFCDEGRFIRPVFTVNSKNKLNITEKDSINWYELLEKEHIAYLDNNEVEHSIIGMDQNDLSKFKCNYVEICPAMMMGVMSNGIPFSDHSQSPRNIYQSSMGKQAIGVYALSHQIRTDTITHVMNYSQKALVSTLPAKFMGFDDLPMGTNAIVAIMVYGG